MTSDVEQIFMSTVCLVNSFSSFLWQISIHLFCSFSCQVILFAIEFRWKFNTFICSTSCLTHCWSFTWLYRHFSVGYNPIYLVLVLFLSFGVFSKKPIAQTNVKKHILCAWISSFYNLAFSLYNYKYLYWFCFANNKVAPQDNLLPVVSTSRMDTRLCFNCSTFHSVLC